MDSLPAELVQWIQQSDDSFTIFDLLATRRTCRALYKKSFTPSEFLWIRLGQQMHTWVTSGAGNSKFTKVVIDNAVRENLGMIRRLMDLGFVVSGGTLLALLHGERWPDAHDIDMYRYAFVNLPQQ